MLSIRPNSLLIGDGIKLQGVFDQGTSELQIRLLSEDPLAEFVDALHEDDRIREIQANVGGPPEPAHPASESHAGFAWRPCFWRIFKLPQDDGAFMSTPWLIEDHEFVHQPQR